MPDHAPAVRVAYFRTLDSTNAEALRRAADGDAGDLWIRADRQTAGRGRSGRTWESAEGNLLTSLLLRPACTLETALQLSLVAGVAVHDAVSELMGGAARPGELALKWPNDLLLGERKLAGILLESVSPVGADRIAIVVGTGLNLAWSPDGATDLAEHGIEASVETAFPVLVAATGRWLGIWRDGAGFGHVRRAWQERAIAAGRAIRVKLPDETVEGSFGGIDEVGALRLLQQTGERRITTGDVFLG